MDTGSDPSVAPWLRRHRFAVLLGSLMLYLLISPMLFGTLDGHLVEAFFSVILLAGLGSVWDRRLPWWVLPAWVLGQVGIWLEAIPLGDVAAGPTLTLLFLGFLNYRMIRHVLSTPRVTAAPGTGRLLFAPEPARDRGKDSR